MSDDEEPTDNADGLRDRLRRLQPGDPYVPRKPGEQQVVLNIDGRSLMTWLRDYSDSAGGIPLTVREPKPDEDQEGSGEANGGH